MKAEVGYITAWRRGIFFSLVGSIILFGLTNTLGAAYLKNPISQNALGVLALLIGIAWVIIVVADPGGHYQGEGNLFVEGDIIRYEDKKRHFKINKKDIKKVDIEPIYIGQNHSKALAFRILVDIGKKKYYIESDRARGREYNEVDLFKLYICLQENTSRR